MKTPRLADTPPKPTSAYRPQVIHVLRSGLVTEHLHSINYMPPIINISKFTNFLPGTGLTVLTLGVLTLTEEILFI